MKAMIIVGVSLALSTSYGFPVLYGDDYTITVQFEGEQPHVFSPSQNWGVGETYNNGDYTGTEFERFSPDNSQGEWIEWRTFSANREEGLPTLHVQSSHVSIRAQVAHPIAKYVDFTVSGLDGWVDYPDLTTLNNFQPNFESIVSTHRVSNIAVTGTTLSFRSPISIYPNTGYEFNIGFKGEPIPEPTSLLLLGLGAVMLRRRR